MEQLVQVVGGGAGCFLRPVLLCCLFTLLQMLFCYEKNSEAEKAGRDESPEITPGSAAPGSAAAGGDCVGCVAAAGCAGCVRSITRGGWAAVVVVVAAAAVRGQTGG